MRFINLLYVFFAVCSAGVAAYYISRRLTVPINQIVDGTKEFAAGNLDYRIDLKSGCEIKKLSDAIDQMAEDLKQRQNELAQANKSPLWGGQWRQASPMRSKIRWQA